jgi:ABC-2 type transport system ATP-binding protein
MKMPAIRSEDIERAEHEPAVSVEGITKRFGETQALSGVDFVVDRGDMFGLIGPDGAGKTTLMRILTSLIDPDGGEARILGFSVRTEAPRVREIIGYMPQHFSLYQDLSVAENMRFFADLFGVGAADRKRRTEELLSFSRLGPFVKRRAGALSGGMKQKLALSCALIHTPQVLVLDEPTTGVDPVSRHDFWEMLARLRADRVTIVISTPYMNEAALCQRMLFIHRGTVLAVGTVDEITRLFPGKVLAVSGPDLRAIAERLKESVPSKYIRILGDRVQVIALDEAFAAVEASLSAMKRDAIVSKDPEEIAPGVEDSFVTLMGD